MKTRIAAICGAVAISGLTLTAQTPPQSPTQPTTRPATPATPATPASPATQARQPASEQMTVTGCLKTREAARAAGPSGAAAGSATSSAAKSVAAAKYVLAAVEPQGTRGTGSSATPRTSTTSETSFALKATGTSVDFSKHVNHKVELTGTLDASAHQMPEARSSGTAGSTGTATPGRDDSAMGMAMPTLNVTALKMVSTTCS
jgi:hypothetical protein